MDGWRAKTRRHNKAMERIITVQRVERNERRVVAVMLELVGLRLWEP